MKNWLTQFLKKHAPWKRKTEIDSREDTEIGHFFTDVEHLRDLFKEYAAAPTLPKRMLVIHGVGGVGKSSLLRMFRLHCKSVNVPVALASGDEAKSALDVLTRWTEDLKTDSVAFPAFGKTHGHYREIQAKVDAQAKKAAGGRAADIAGKAASKTAEAAGGALAGAAIGSVIPGIGTAIGGALGGVLGGMGAEALVDWLRGFLTKPDIDLLLDPAKKLTNDFLADVAPAADKRRIVLMLDTFEQMTALDDWACDIAQRLHANALFVIAGRALPNWSRAWQSWMANAQVEELKPMTEDAMRELIRRYYATMRGGQPNPVQVEAIIRFARGLPMVVTSAVQLWVKYGVEDFQSVKAEIVANLVDRLVEGVPKELTPALEAAAVVRWFDQPILRAVTELADVRDVYNELRRFPFVRTRAEGLALHDAVREIIDENLRVQDSERHCELHERAAAYFEARLGKVTGDEAERLGLEQLYHRVLADEESGIKLFQETSEELARFGLTNRLRTFLNDVNTYPLDQENSRLWREYYNARLAYLEGRLTEAEKVYQDIGENEQVEPKLRAYALYDWGEVLARAERLLSNPQGAEHAIKIVQLSLSTIPLDTKTVSNYKTLSGIYEIQFAWPKAWAALNQLLQFHVERDDLWGQADAYFALQWQYHLVGDFKQMLAAQEAGNKAAASFLSRPFVRMKTLRTTIGWIEMGRYAEVERNFRETLRLLPELNTAEFESEIEVNLALALGVQGKFQEAYQRFENALAIRKEADDEFFRAYWETFWGRIFLQEGNFDEALSHLKLSLDLKLKFKVDLEIPETLNWLGILHELRQEWIQAEDYYRRSRDDYHVGRRYLEACALAGLLRVKYAHGQSESAVALFAEAENLAQQYEYNDHLASLNLIKGHLAWKDPGSPKGSGFDSALHFYRHALIYALRYNRFLLDEVLWGGDVATPLRPLIPFCVEQGEEGRRMLMALHDWWQTGANSIGAPRSDTISPIPENIPLLQAERIARQRELGDNSPQQTVVKRINAMLTTRHDG